jgi:hypothetical protein
MSITTFIITSLELLTRHSLHVAYEMSSGR